MVKTCAFCEKTDGMCYTSNPPKRKCIITGKFHEYDHICDAPQTNADRIRAMSDEELADILYKFAHSNNKPLNKGNLLEWLKQPAEEQ